MYQVPIGAHYWIRELLTLMLGERLGVSPLGRVVRCGMLRVTAREWRPSNVVTDCGSTADVLCASVLLLDRGKRPKVYFVVHGDGEAGAS